MGRAHRSSLERHHVAAQQETLRNTMPKTLSLCDIERKSICQCIAWVHAIMHGKFNLPGSTLDCLFHTCIRCPHGVRNKALQTAVPMVQPRRRPDGQKWHHVLVLKKPRGRALEIDELLRHTAWTGLRDVVKTATKEKNSPGENRHRKRKHFEGARKKFR